MKQLSWAVLLALLAGCGAPNELRARPAAAAMPGARDVAPVALKTSDDVLNYIVAHPEQVSLATYDVNAPEKGIYHRADGLRPLASTFKIMVLYACASRVNQGELKLNEAVKLADVEAFYLPGTDGGAHAAALDSLRKQGGLSADGKLSLKSVLWAMMRYSDNCATDYLIDRLGSTALREVPVQLGLPPAEYPFSIVGLMLLWRNPDETGTPSERWHRLRALDPEVLRQAAFRMAARWTQDAAFRERTLAYAPAAGQRESFADAVEFSETWTRGSARDYAGLMARVYSGTLGPRGTTTVMRSFLEWPMAEFSTSWTAFDAVGTKGGSLPGVLTDAWYVKRKLAPSARVSALFFDRLPEDANAALDSSFAQQKFEVQLLGDDAFFERVRARLRGLPTAP